MAHRGSNYSCKRRRNNTRKRDTPNQGSNENNRPKDQTWDDPFFHALADPKFTLSKGPGVYRIYSGLEGLPTITATSYSRLCMISSNFLRQVSPSVYAYYVAALAYSKLIRLSLNNCTDEEVNFATRVDLKFFCLPNEIVSYLEGMGDITSPHGRTFEFAKEPTNYQRSGEIPGYFGRVNQDTHYLYSTYPCLAVYAQRIKEDILFTRNSKRDKNWDLPEDIRPVDQGAGHPNENMLGWAPAMKLTEGQVEFLKRDCYKEDGNTKFESKDLPLKSSLLRNVHIILSFIGVEKGLTNTPFLSRASQAQLLHIHSEGRHRNPMLMNELVAYSPVKLPASIVANGTATIYRVFRNVDADAIKNWAIYNFTNFTLVPREWIDTCNSLREKEPQFLSGNVYQVGTYELSWVTDKLQENLGKYENYRYDDSSSDD